MENKRNEHIILNLFLVFLLPQVTSCGRSSASSVQNLPCTGRFSFLAECPGSKSVCEATEQTLMENGFSIAALDCAKELEAFSDYAFYDKEGGLFRTEGFYSKDPGKTMNFYASWPERVSIGTDGQARIIVPEMDENADIIAASTLSADCGAESVNLHFKHILGRIQVLARGIDTEVSYTLTGLSVTVPAEGHYNFATGQWNYDGYKIVPISEGEDITAIPGTVLIAADWFCEYQDIIIASYHRTASIDISEGRITTVTLLLPNDGAEELGFDTELSFWMGNTVPVEL